MQQKNMNFKQKEMKHIYKLAFMAVVGMSSLSLMAQKDTTLTRQIMLEREYTPTVQEASRINSNPVIYDYVVQKSNVTFIDQAPALSIPSNKLGKVKSGDIKNDIEFNKKRGYLHAGIGNYTNVDVALGYRLLDSQNNQLDVFGTYDAANGTVNYAMTDGYSANKMKAKYADLLAKLNYTHTFTPSLLNLYTSYRNLGYNYYGNSFIPENSPITNPYDYKTMQKNGIFSLGGSLKSREENEDLLAYEGSIAYNNFKQSEALSDKDGVMKGGILDIDLDASYELASDNFAGGRVSFINQSLAVPSRYSGAEFDGYTNITVNPYYKIAGGSWFSEVGLNLSGIFNNKTKMLLSPNIKAGVNIHEVNTLYASVTGGVNDNTFLEILEENRYAQPFGKVEYSKTLYDFKIGFKSGIVKGMMFDVFAGYKNTKDDHLFIASPYLSNITKPFTKWGNVGVPAYADISTGHIGGEVKTNLIPYTTLSAKLVGYSYGVKSLSLPANANAMGQTAKAWERPTLSFDINCDIKLVDEMTISANYLYLGGRNSYQHGLNAKMKNVNELNLRISYQVLAWFDVYARVNNVLNQKYDLSRGYTLQGINALGGFGFKF